MFYWQTAGRWIKALSQNVEKNQTEILPVGLASGRTFVANGAGLSPRVCLHLFRSSDLSKHHPPPWAQSFSHLDIPVLSRLPSPHGRGGRSCARAPVGSACAWGLRASWGGGPPRLLFREVYPPGPGVLLAGSGVGHSRPPWGGGGGWESPDPPLPCRVLEKPLLGN